jgi:hypothetical protein
MTKIAESEFQICVTFLGLLHFIRRIIDKCFPYLLNALATEAATPILWYLRKSQATKQDIIKKYFSCLLRVYYIDSFQLESTLMFFFICVLGNNILRFLCNCIQSHPLYQV